MTTVSSYDFSSLLQLLLLGLVVALGPLAWIWAHQRRAEPSRRLHALTLLTLFFTFDLVLFGAFTRLTDSGLGCPDWPGCYGHASPLGAAAQIEAAQTALPSGPVTHGKAWIEMIHRYLAMGVGVLILAMTAQAWQQRRRLHVSPWWPTLTLLWVCIQGAFGALTVTMKLFPAIVTLHLLGGILLLVLLRAQSLHMIDAERSSVPAGTRRLLLLTAALVLVQIALGGWVSTNYAVLACTDFPACQGSWWPPMDFSQGFSLWRELGMTPAGDAINFSALTAIHYTHRLFAWLVFAALIWLALRLLALPALRQGAYALLALALWQLVSGVSNVLLGWPLASAVAHTGGAAALAVVLTGLVYRCRGEARRFATLGSAGRWA